MNTTMRRLPSLRASRGVTLVELLIALVIGSVLIAGAVYIYSQSRRSATVSDAQARLQENARYVMSVIEPDLQLAGYYGFSNRPDDIKLITNGSTGSSTSTPTIFKATSAILSVTNDCGINFSINLIRTIEGRDNSYGLDCAALAGGALANADTLVIRRSSNPPSTGNGTAVNGRLQVLSSRLSPTNQFLFADGKLPTTPALATNLVQVRDLIVRVYYVATNAQSPDVAGLPTLRMKSLTDGPAYTDTSDVELMRGVEDFQVQYGIDTGDYDANGAIDSGRDVNSDGIPDASNGVATRYVNADVLNTTYKGFQVVSVRVWLLLRAENPEQGFTDNHNYKYANRDVTKNDGYRRVLMSRTIQLRNTRTL